jgi:(p)ppGpp synthase/HD superfamily hydrolase
MNSTQTALIKLVHADALEMTKHNAEQVLALYGAMMEFSQSTPQVAPETVADIEALEGWIERAMAESLAREAHHGQKRRDGVTPYITHPEAVAKSLAGESPTVIATAWLHDVLEDTHITVDGLAQSGISPEVIEAVESLTRKDEQPYDDYIHWISMSEIARKVKIADIKHNLSCTPTEKQREKYTKALAILEGGK